MGKTTISWASETENPIRARHNGKTGHYCEKISAGCRFCYSSKLQPRLFGMPEFQEQRREGTEVFLEESVLARIRAMKKPTRLFWCSMTDLFGEWVSLDWIRQCAEVMRDTPHLQHLILTKRHDRMREVLNSELPWWGALDQVWFGVSVEDRRFGIPRIEVLRETNARNKWLSVEPLLENLGEVDFQGIQWAVLGGESGPGARPCNPDWIQDLVRQCDEQRVSPYVKQLGSVWAKDNGLRGKGEDPSKWDGDLRRQEYPEPRETLQAGLYRAIAREPDPRPSRKDNEQDARQDLNRLFD